MAGDYSILGSEDDPAQVPDMTPPELSYQDPPRDLSLGGLVPTLSLDSAPDVGQSGVTKPAFDAMGLLKDAMAANSKQIDGITAHRDKLRDERNSLAGQANNDWGGVGSALLTGLASLAVGGTPGQAATEGGKSAVTYYNNLDAQEKTRRLDLENDMKFDESSLGRLTNFNDQLALHAASLTEQQQVAQAKGEFPGTPEFQAQQDAKRNLFTTEADYRENKAIEQRQRLKDAGLTGSGQLDGNADPQVVKAYAAQLGIDPEQPITNRAFREALAAKGLSLGAQRTENAQSRFNVSQSNQDLKTAAPGMFDNLKDPVSGQPKPLNPKQQDTVAQLGSGLDTIVRNADQLISHLQDDRLSIGDKLMAQKQDINNMLPAIRSLDNQGVRFNQFIKNIDVNQIGDDAELLSRFEGYFTGEDPQAAVTRFVQEITRQASARAVNNNAVLNPDKVKAYSPDSFDLMNKWGAFNFNRGATSAPTTSGAPTGFNPQDPGFLAWKAKNGRR